MMHYDSIRNPVSLTSEKGSGPSRKVIETSQNFLANNSYQEFDDKDLEQAIIYIYILIILKCSFRAFDRPKSC